MAVISRDAVKLPALPKETHPCPPLGGEVVVRSLLLSERLALSAGAVALPFDQFVPRLLALTVVDDKGEQILDESQWNQLGATKANAPHILALFDAACTLCGFDQAAEKKD